MIVVQKDVKFTKLVFYETKFQPKIRMYCGCTDDTYDPEVNDDGFYIYELPEQDARQKLKHRSDRWRLFAGRLSNGDPVKPLPVQLESPTGALKWEIFYPWEYEMKTFSDGKHENGETKTIKKAVWKELKPASENKKKV